MKIMVFVQEILSVILTPFVLWYSLPQCAPAIIDFFREFTVHVDGLGFVCSFAVFDFQRHGNVKVNLRSLLCVNERLISPPPFFFSLVRLLSLMMNDSCRRRARWRRVSSTSRYILTF